MNERMYNEINDILYYTEGDIIDFRVYKGKTFAHLVKLGIAHNRHVVGMDTFTGLEEPSLIDRNKDNYILYPRGYAKTTPDLAHASVKQICGETDAYTIHEGKLADILPKLPKRTYAFALIDLFHYNPTKLVLEYIYEHMAPGGVLYFLNYESQEQGLASKAINEFLEEKEEDIYQLPDIVYYGTIQKVCRVAVKQSIIKSDDSDTPAPNKKRKLFGSGKQKTDIALVLRTGGDTYNYKYVNAMAQNIRNVCTSNYSISVLTDNAEGIDSNLVDEVIPLRHNYPGWWSKIELFRPGLFNNQVLFMDLDTVIVRNIDDLLRYRPSFAGIRDMYKPIYLQTGILSWNPSLHSHIYENFVPRAQRVITDYNLGDAQWIRENVTNYRYISDDFPERVVSYKAHCLSPDGKSVTIPPKRPSCVSMDARVRIR